MNFRAFIIALFFILSVSYSYAKVEQLQSDLEVIIPTRGKIYHPGTDEHFNNALKTFDLAIVDFYAEWCGPCKQMHKVMDDLATDTNCDDILFIKVNTDQQRSLSNRYNITSLPTIMFFVDGKLIKTIYGYHTKKQMRELISATFRIQKA